MFTTPNTNGAHMAEITAENAALLVGVSDETIRRLVNRDILPARRVGLRRFIKIDLNDLRKVAADLNYRFDEDAAVKFVEN